MDPTYPLVPIANFIAFILVLLPLLTGIARKSWNIGVIMFAIWIAVQSLITAINTIVWSDNFSNSAPVWCDITSHIWIGFVVAIPACSLSITRRLYNIMHRRSAVISEREKKINMMIDIGLCVGVPFLQMGLYTIVQITRFQIWEEIGCISGEMASGLSLLLIDVWPIVMPAASAIFYCPRIVWVFYRHRKEVNKFLDSNQSLNHGEYFRLMALSCLDITVTLPIGIVGLIPAYMEVPVVFYPGWKLVHSDWTVIQTPSSMWNQLVWIKFNVKWDDWINVFFAAVFFLLFGVTKEARSKYMQVIGVLAKSITPSSSTAVKKSDIVFSSVTPGIQSTLPSQLSLTSVHGIQGADNHLKSDLEAKAEMYDASNKG